jgi:hypothetical protein
MTTENLWGLSIESLDSMAIAVNQELKTTEVESFRTISKKRNTEKSTLQLKLDILKHILSVKENAELAAKTRAEKRAKVAQLQDLIAQKSNEALASTSLEDLQKMVAEIGSDEEE